VWGRGWSGGSSSRRGGDHEEAQSILGNAPRPVGGGVSSDFAGIGLRGLPHRTDHGTRILVRHRVPLGQIAEGALAEVRERFGIPGNDLFHFPPGQGKIHIFAYQNHFPQEWGGQSYYGGLLIYSLDHEERGKAGHNEIQLYPDVEFVGYYYFYPMFHLALRYLIDPAGRGRSCLDARDLWVDVGGGMEFSVALRNRFGSSESEFEDQFFQLMRDYLPSVNLPPTNPLPSGIR